MYVQDRRSPAPTRASLQGIPEQTCTHVTQLVPLHLLHFQFLTARALSDQTKLQKGRIDIWIHSTTPNPGHKSIILHKGIATTSPYISDWYML